MASSRAADLPDAANTPSRLCPAGKAAATDEKKNGDDRNCVTASAQDMGDPDAAEPGEISDGDLCSNPRDRTEASPAAAVYPPVKAPHLFVLTTSLDRYLVLSAVALAACETPVHAAVAEGSAAAADAAEEVSETETPAAPAAAGAGPSYRGCLMWRLGCLGGWTQSLSASCAEPSRVSVGCGDATIRAADLSSAVNAQLSSGSPQASSGAVAVADAAAGPLKAAAADEAAPCGEAPPAAAPSEQQQLWRRQQQLRQQGLLLSAAAFSEAAVEAAATSVDAVLLPPLQQQREHNRAPTGQQQQQALQEDAQLLLFLLGDQRQEARAAAEAALPSLLGALPQVSLAGRHTSHAFAAFPETSSSKSGCSPHVQAALLLAAGLVPEAVEAYLQANLASFALLLCRLRLRSEHPLQYTAFDAWLAEPSEETLQEEHEQDGQQNRQERHLQDWQPPQEQHCQQEPQKRIGRLLRLALMLESLPAGS
ncbi:AF4/FMR2 family member 4 [Cyclospora cayetanensis]|uniref:AF4/FMR2 family member 4 n=1 Tax=Cyclospora cayetanensis TaxID=88456 RepID=A0A6P6RZ79_9EIME|nr:AF4/FMR2 family member 4 [Cyclospora cayetanensis]